jgi:hypothetical protein
VTTDVSVKATDSSVGKTVFGQLEHERNYPVAQQILFSVMDSVLCMKKRPWHHTSVYFGSLMQLNYLRKHFILQTAFQLNGLIYCNSFVNFPFIIGMFKFDKNLFVQYSSQFSQNGVTASSGIYVTDMVAQGNPGLTYASVSLSRVVDDQTSI